MKEEKGKVQSDSMFVASVPTHPTVPGPPGITNKKSTKNRKTGSHLMSPGNVPVPVCNGELGPYRRKKRRHRLPRVPFRPVRDWAWATPVHMVG